jgi:large conductance mechanosensitive channel
MLKDFRKFILRGNVVDLAVAVVVGAAFNSVIQSFVRDIIQPLINGITGSNKGAVQGVAHFHLGSHPFIFPWGDFVSSIISFFIIASVVFFFVVQPLNKLVSHLKPADDVERPAERSCPECLSAIPAAASRCKYCTAELVPDKPKPKSVKALKKK